MPNRVIKDTIRTSRNVNLLSDFQFRLWMYLITYVDDFGRGSADPELLKGLVFPRRKGVTEKQIADALVVLANTGMVILYEVDGEPFFYFPNWSAHQRIQTKRSKFPEPTEENSSLPESTVTHGELPSESNTIQTESETNSIQGIVGSTAKRFTPPTLEQVKEYCAERGNKVDPQRFIDHYTSNGWKVGKNPMKDWKSTVRNWERNSFNDSPKPTQGLITNNTDYSDIYK